MNNLNNLKSMIDDGMDLIPVLLWDRQMVSGVGAMELKLARWVDLYVGTMKRWWQQDVVKRFARALEAIPWA